MSRVQTLHIPFVSGFSEAADPKVLPDGVFAEVRNGRLPAAGSLRLRRGWRPLTMNEQDGGATLTAVDLWSTGESLVALTNFGDEAGRGLVPATLVEASSSRPWKRNTDAGLSPVTQVRNVGAMPALSTGVNRASAAVTSDGVYGCVLEQSSSESVVRVFEMATDETVLLASLSNGSRVRKVVSMGLVFGLVENTGTGLDLYTLTPTASAPAFSLTATLFSATVTAFDVAVATETAPTALHVTDVVAGAVSYRKFTFAGSQTGSTKTVSASGALISTICCDDAVAHVAYQDSTSKELSLLSFASTGSFTTAAGPTAVDAGVAVPDGQFAVGMPPSASVLTAFTAYVAVAYNISGVTNYRVRVFNTSHTAASSRAAGLHDRERMVCGFLTRGFQMGVGAVRDTQAVLQDSAQPWAHVDSATATISGGTIFTPLWPGVSATGDALALFFRDTGVTPNTVPRSLTVRALKLGSTSRRPAALLGGALYVSGGTLAQVISGAVTEQGMLAPIIDSTTPSNTASGALTAGTYSYRAVVVWEDEKQRVHRSVVSDAVDEELAGAEDTVTAVVEVAKTLRRSSNLIVNPRVELYRTEVGPGTLFYLCASGACSVSDDDVSIVDTMSDATLVTQPQLYTQGETGATSGILDACPARPSAYVAATKRRLVCGSADTSYQFSQVQFPETQVWFAEPGIVGDAGQAYLDDVEGGRITAVFALDELVFVATRDRIYVTGGAGPNLAGTGEFAPPTRLPTDVGVYDWRSVLELAEGAWFRGTESSLFRLPRGAAQPEEVHDVQTRLTSAKTIVGAGYEAADGTAVWAVSDATAIVRQLAEGRWLGDALPFTPIALTTHAGRVYAVASTGVVWEYSASAFGDGTAGATAVALRVATGQIAPFELAGHGRLAAVEIQGDYQSAAAVLGEISYDDGQTWTSLGSHAVSGLSVNDTFQRQWYPARQRGQRFRVRVTMTPTSTTAEGCRLTGLTLYFTKQSGPTRLPSASRK